MKPVDSDLCRIPAAKRIAYTLIGLLAGDLILFFSRLQNAVHTTLVEGESARVIADAVQEVELYAIYSFVGWMFVGLPAALIFSARWIKRLSLPLAMILGALLGPLALLVIFLLLAGSNIYFYNLAEIGTLLAYSALVSTISSVVYVGLMRREIRGRTGSSTVAPGLIITRGKPAH